jgi:anti-sigma regulatory factor (Ser/Thr protein kinase)
MHEPNSEYKTITVPAEVDELDRVQAFLGEELEEAGCDPGPQMQVELAVEEIFVNVASYAYAPEEGEVEIRIRILGDPAMAEIVFLDSGKPYNPLEKEDAALDEDAIMEREGGLGILLTKEVMDEVDYCYRNGKNVFTMRKKLV